MQGLIFVSVVLFIAFESAPDDANALPNESRCSIRVSYSLIIDSDSFITDSAYLLQDSGSLFADSNFLF